MNIYLTGKINTGWAMSAIIVSVFKQTPYKAENQRLLSSSLLLPMCDKLSNSGKTIRDSH